MALIGTYTQQPAEKLDYDIDYSEWLDAGDTVLSATATALPAGLAVLPIVSATAVKVWAYGGTDKTTYEVTVTMTSAAGRIKQDEIKIICKEI